MIQYVGVDIPAYLLIIEIHRYLHPIPLHDISGLYSLESIVSVELFLKSIKLKNLNRFLESVKKDT